MKTPSLLSRTFGLDQNLDIRSEVASEGMSSSCCATFDVCEQNRVGVEFDAEASSRGSGSTKRMSGNFGFNQKDTQQTPERRVSGCK
jgi:hypothetical protein